MHTQRRVIRRCKLEGRLSAKETEQRDCQNGNLLYYVEMEGCRNAKLLEMQELLEYAANMQGRDITRTSAVAYNVVSDVDST